MVYVGPERSGFVIHRNVSSNSSDVFKHWFELAFRENNGVVELPACDFIPFGPYQKFLYSSKLHTIMEGRSPD